MTQDIFTAMSLCNNASLRRATRRLGQFYDEVLAPSGLRATQQGLLHLIRESREPAMKELADALVMDLSALGHTLKPLIRDGLVETLADPRDRRVKRVRLTAAGSDRLDEALKLWAVAQQRLEELIGKQEAAQLRGTLDRLARQDFGPAPQAD
jgi:DNA-binding MarR family transcriptional regulator